MYPWLFIADSRPPEMERKAPMKEPRPRDVARNQKWKESRGGEERVRDFRANKRDQRETFHPGDRKPADNPREGWKPKFDKGAARKSRAAKFQSKGDGGHFAKFADGKRKPAADLPPRRRP